MQSIYRIFVKGLLTLLPITLTIYLLIWITTRTENLFAQPLQSSSLYFPGLGVLISFAFILLVGMLVNNYLAARAIAWAERQLQSIPLFKAIYNPLRDILNLFSDSKGKGDKRVVLAQLTPGGPWAIGLVTRDRFQDLHIAGLPLDHIAVFIPYSYAVGGFTVLIHKDQTRPVDVPAEKAMQIALTAWIGQSRQHIPPTNHVNP